MTLGMMILIVFALLTLVLAFVTLHRYIAFKERVALAELGFLVEDLKRKADKRYGNKGVLWGGVITGMSGLALLLGLATLGSGAWLLAGLLPLFVGLGMVIIYFMTFGPAPEAKVDETELDNALSDLGAQLSEARLDDEAVPLDEPR